MDTGHDFLRAQINNCIAQHQSLLDALHTQVEQADDPRLRTLCERHIPKMQHHQTLLEAYGDTIGTRSGGAVKNALGAVLGKARDVVDSFRETDFRRVVGDIVMIRQSQDTFATFARAGTYLGNTALAELGLACESDHDMMQQEFNDLIAHLFVAQVNGTVIAPAAIPTTSTANV